MKRDFIAVDDYGQGGIWLLIRAESAEQILAVYPELDVFEEPPAFLPADSIERIRREKSFDIDAPPSGYLADIVADRSDGR